MAAITALCASCLPKEIAMPEEDTDSSEAPTYAGFSGATSVQTVGATKVKVTWNKSTDTEVVAYNIYDSTFLFAPVLLKTVAASAAEATLTNLTAGKYYTFRVRAADDSMKEDGNMTDLGGIPYAGVLPAQVQSSTSAVIPFADGSNADQINVFCKSGTGNYAQVATVSNVNQTSALITGLISGTTYTCRAALQIGSFTDNNLATTVFMPMGQATQMVFSTQPGSSAAGVELPPQPVVTIKDVNGNTVSAGPDSTVVVTLNIAAASPSVGTIRGSSSVAAVGGVATFSGINLQESGLKIISATKEDTSGQTFGTAPLTVNSAQFNISPGPVSALNSSIAISPAVPPNSALVANGTNSYSVEINLKDSFGNPVVGTRPTFTSNIPGDTFSQPTLATDSTGKASGSIASTIADTVAPFRMLSINSPAGLNSVTIAAPFVPGPATKLAFSTQPVNSPAGEFGMPQVTVAIQDAQGNVVSTGPNSTATVSLSIASNVNGAILLGTISANAVSGVASFGDLGIDRTGTGYKLLASSGSYSPAYSNNFNVTPGVPRKISITGPANTVSGLCSTAIVVQLRDQGNNPANAIQNTPVVLSGLGSASLYNSSSCTGTAISTTLTFTAGTHTKTLYLKNPKAEALTIAGTDTSAVLTLGTLALNSTPSKLSITAQAPPPANAGTPMSVVAGQCSTEIVITPMGDNGQPGPLFAITNVAVTGLTGTQARIYSDAACTQQLTAAAVPLPVSIGTNYTTKIYLKDDKAEDFSLSIVDSSGTMTTISGLQSVKVGPSNINFTGPTSVVAGQCSTPYVIALRDRLNNSVVAASNTTLNLQGLGGSSTALFYTSPGCGGAGTNTSVTIPQGSSFIQVYFRGTAAETLTVTVSDPLLKLANSQSIIVGVSPSALNLVMPSPASAKTTVCAGPFTVNALDGLGSVTAAITPITVNLGGSGNAGTFFSDAQCSSQITSLLFAQGVSTRTFYLVGQYPGTLALTATDAAAVLTAAGGNFQITAAPAWIGTSGSMTNSNDNLFWFQQGFVPVAARTNGPSSAYALKFDSTKQYLYVADELSHRVLKYDYTNKTYVGWIGQYSSRGAIGISGSNLSTPSAASCVATVNGSVTPGWCVGGLSTWNDNVASGGMRNPYGVAEDGTFIYIAHRWGHAITRHYADTGAFAGWIGRVGTTPTAAGPDGPGSCTSTLPGSTTPGWCRGGSIWAGDTTGNGGIRHPRAVEASGGYVYVAQQGAILRYSTTDGSFQGWIGMVSTVAPTGGEAGCTTAGNNTRTPGWCTGGTFQIVNPKTAFGGGGVHDPTSLLVIGSTLYVMHTDNGGTITTYDVNTGAYTGLLPSLASNWRNPRQMTTDGTDLYVADWDRLIKVDLTGLVLSWMGKVSNNNSMSGNAGCSTLQPNDNTPGWCLGGSSKAGLDERAFNQLTAVAFDGAGNIITGQGTEFPAIKTFNATTGAYGGTLAYQSTSPRQWSNDASSFAQLYGFDDYSMFAPAGSYNDGTHLYVTEFGASRIKKIEIATGKLVGWIGGISTVPTAGPAGCTSANPMGPSPGWCLGALFNPSYLWNSMIPERTDGIMLRPMAITGDGTFLYVADNSLHRIQKFNMVTGAYVGWIGRISVAPIGGAVGCVGAASGTFTPGWCTGGMSQAGGGDGHLSAPSGLVFLNGNLYVVDVNNHRISSYNATTGAFNGWIGRVSTAPTGGCTTAANGSGYSVSTTGWCTGGTSAGSVGGDRGGGFAFWNGRGGIATDGTSLYIANFYNVRIDKYSTGGVYQGSANTRQDQYTNVWTTNGATLASWAVGCSYPLGIYVDGSNIYGNLYSSCGGHWTANTVFKMNASTGTMVGWQGGINPGQSPIGGDPGCAGAVNVTPGWCVGGASINGYRLGQFSDAWMGISGDANFLYISDETTHRLTRLPK